MSPAWLPRACFAIMLFCTALVLSAHAIDWLAGGHPWKQGDWLINLADGPLRRGMAGALLLAFGDQTGLGPLAPLMWLQAGLLLGLVAAFWAAARPLIVENPVWATLFFSPGFFVLFWAGDTDGSMRKEMLMFTAFALLAASLTKPHIKALQTLALILAAMSGFAHEANVLLLPAFLLMMGLVLQHQGRPLGLSLGLAAALALAGAVALGYALLYPDGTPAAVCDPLLARGLGPNICTGAIDWLDRGNAKGSVIYAANFSAAALITFPLAYVLVLVPAGLVICQHSRPRLTLALAVISALPLVPLYLVAVDWGRWMSLHIVSLSFLLAALRLTGRIVPVRALPLKPLLALLALSMLWSPRATTSLAKGGPVVTLLRQVF